MKRVLLFFTLTALFATSVLGNHAHAALVPAPVGDIYVQDFAHILTFNQKKKLIALGTYLDDQTGAQIAVLTINSLNNRTVEDYAVQALREYRLGGAEKNNGVLLLLSLQEREIKIEVGYGLEGALPDAKVGRILDTEALPFLKNDEIDSAIMNTYKKLFTEVSSEYQLNTEAVPDVYEDGYQDSEGPSLLTILIFTFIVLGIVFLDIRFLGGAFTLTLLKILVALARRGGGGGGPGGGGPRIGGGGSSGGGGASRKW